MASLLPQIRRPVGNRQIANRWQGVRPDRGGALGVLDRYSTANSPAQWFAQAAQLYPMDRSYAATPNALLQQQARAQIQPYFQQTGSFIKNAINARAKSGGEAITAYMGDYIKKLGDIAGEINTGYDQALGRQGALNDSLTNFVQSHGTEMSNQLAAAEQAAGQTSAGSQQVQGVTSGSSGAQAGMGWSAMSQLINDAAAANAYGKSLPASGVYQGTNMIHDLNRQAQLDLNEALGSLATQMPQSVQQVYQSLLDRELQKAGLRQGNQNNMADYVRAQQRQAYEEGIWRKEFGASRVDAAAQRDVAGGQLGIDYYIDSKGRKVKVGYTYNKKGQLVPISDGAGQAQNRQVWYERIGSVQEALQNYAARLVYGVPSEAIDPTTGQTVQVQGKPMLRPIDKQRRVKFINRMTKYVMATAGVPEKVARQYATNLADGWNVMNGPGVPVPPPPEMQPPYPPSAASGPNPIPAPPQDDGSPFWMPDFWRSITQG